MHCIVFEMVYCGFPIVTHYTCSIPDVPPALREPLPPVQDLADVEPPGDEEEEET